VPAGNRPKRLTCAGMTTPRIRPLLAVAVVAAVLSYGLSGQGPPQMSSHDGMAGATAGLCLLLVIVLMCAAAPEPEAHHPTVVTDGEPSYVDPPQRPPLDGRARASPSALQRFRN
jgi:hypothetical protein